MKKILIISLVILTAFAFAGCDKQAENPSIPENQQTIEADLFEVRDKIINDLSISDAILIESADLFDLYGISEDMLLQSASFVTMDGTFPHEIVMTQGKDSKTADTIESALSTRLSEVLLQSKSYDAENYALAQECKVVRKGEFVSIFLSPLQNDMLSVYNEFIK